MILNLSAMVWMAGALTVLGLAGYRKIVATREDDILHLRDSELPQVCQQTEVATKLDRVDKWGVNMTIGVIAFGVVLAAVFVYQQWLVSLEPLG